MGAVAVGIDGDHDCWLAFSSRTQLLKGRIAPGFLDRFQHNEIFTGLNEHFCSAKCNAKTGKGYDCQHLMDVIPNKAISKRQRPKQRALPVISPKKPKEAPQLVTAAKLRSARFFHVAHGFFNKLGAGREIAIFSGFNGTL